MSFVFYLFTLILSISFCVVAFLLLSAGDLTKFKTIHEIKRRNSQLPIITKYGDVISTSQDLDFQLTNLKAKLREKFQDLDNNKTKMELRLKGLNQLESYKR